MSGIFSAHIDAVLKSARTAVVELQAANLFGVAAELARLLPQTSGADYLRVILSREVIGASIDLCKAAERLDALDEKERAGEVAALIARIAQLSGAVELKTVGRAS